MEEANKKLDINELYDLAMKYKEKNSITDTEMIDILVTIVANLKSMDAYLGYLANSQAKLQEQVKMINMCGF